jgi:prolyl oligopeptidase
MPHADGPLTYPDTRTVDQVDDHHGTKVADPYRWLEDLDAPDTAEWVRAQNAVTMPFLERLREREPLRARVTELWDFEKVGAPFHRAGRWFVFRNDGLQNQNVLYAMDGIDGDQRVLLDPNAWSDEGTVALSGLAPTDDGARLAYAISRAGSDWQEWKVLDVATGGELDDHLLWSKFSGAAWLPDGSGFFYSRYDEPTGDALEEANYFQKLFFHRLGTAQADDALVYERPEDKELGLGAGVTDDGRFLAVTVWRGTDPKNGFAFAPLDGAGNGAAAAVVPLLDDFDASYTFVGNDGDRLFFRTDLDAPLGRVVAIDVTSPARESWVEVIAESDATLESVTFTGGRFFASYLVDAHSAVRVHAKDGTFEREIGLPGLGTAMGFGGRDDDTETFYAFTSFTDPGTIYRYDIASGTSTIWHRPRLAFDPDDYATTQVFVESKDGTRVPVFVTARKDVLAAPTTPAPTYLYGYGGFQIPMTPAFSVGSLAWMERGGVYAQACLRGGGEYGEEWHLAGTKDRKQHVFDDCIAVAEWLVSSGRTTTSQLVLAGGSNGGLLVGACMTQRPDLFAVCLPSRGVLDMLRFHKFTIGWAWVSDYGSADDPGEFDALYAYSPLHNLREGMSYPATLVTTADHDDRVVPSHSFKFTAALQAAQAGDAPVLIRVEVDAGHGAGTPTTKLIEELADVRAFAAHIVGLDVG